MDLGRVWVYFHDPYAVRHSIYAQLVANEGVRALGQQKFCLNIKQYSSRLESLLVFGCRAKAMITTLLSLLPFHSSPVFPFL